MDGVAGGIAELLEVPRAVPRAQLQPRPRSRSSIPRATPAMASVCTAGSNSLLLNLAPLNSPLLRQGQDEATGSVVLEQPQFVFPSAVSWDSSGTTVQRDEALVCQDLREPLSPHGPAWPRISQSQGRNGL